MKRDRNPAFLYYLNDKFKNVDVDKAIEIFESNLEEIESCADFPDDYHEASIFQDKIDFLRSDLGVTLFISSLDKYNKQTIK